MVEKQKQQEIAAGNSSLWHFKNNYCLVNVVFFFGFFFFLPFLVALGFCCYAQAFSSCGAQTSHCGGFSCYRVHAPGPQSLLGAAHRLTGCGT